MTSRTFTLQVAAQVVAPPPGFPSWANNASLLQWVQIPGSNIANVVPSIAANLGGVTSSRVIEADCGMCVSASGDMYLFGGGHSDYGGNEVYRIQLNKETATCQRLIDPTPVAQVVNATNGIGYNLDGHPVARHTYSALAFDDIGNRMLSFGVRSSYPNAQDANFCDAFYPTATGGTWSARGDQAWNGIGNPPMPTFGSSVSFPPATCEVRTTGDVYMFTVLNNTSAQLWKYTRATNALTRLAQDNGPARNLAYDATALDTTRMRLINLGLTAFNNIAANNLRYWDINTLQYVDPVLSGPAAAEFDANGFMSTVVYVPSMDAVLRLQGLNSVIYKMDCATFACTTLATTGTPPPTPTSGCFVAQSPAHMHKKFVYVPSLKGCVYIPQWGPVYYLRTDP